MTQVHKEQLNQVENAIAGRGGLDIEIFGMEGVPPEIIDQHNQQVTQQHFADERARQQATGNPSRGSGLNGTGNKRAKKNETLEEIQQRAEKFRVDRANGVLPPPPVADITLEPVRTRENAALDAFFCLRCYILTNCRPRLQSNRSLPRPAPHKANSPPVPSRPAPTRPLVQAACPARLRSRPALASAHPRPVPSRPTARLPVRTSARRWIPSSRTRRGPPTPRVRRRARRTRTSSWCFSTSWSVPRRRWRCCRGTRSLAGREREVLREECGVSRARPFARVVRRRRGAACGVGWMTTWVAGKACRGRAGWLAGSLRRRNQLSEVYHIEWENGVPYLPTYQPAGAEKRSRRRESDGTRACDVPNKILVLHTWSVRIRYIISHISSSAVHDRATPSVEGLEKHNAS